MNAPYLAAVGRGLEGSASGYVDRMRDLLVEIEPNRVDREASAVIAETSNGAWLVIPHRDFDGFALAVALGSDHAELFWLDYQTLERMDDLDRDRVEKQIASFSQTSDVGESWIDTAIAETKSTLCSELILETTVETQFRPMVRQEIRGVLPQTSSSPMVLWSRPRRRASDATWRDGHERDITTISFVG